MRVVVVVHYSKFKKPAKNPVLTYDCLVTIELVYPLIDLFLAGFVSPTHIGNEIFTSSGYQVMRVVVVVLNTKLKILAEKAVLTYDCLVFIQAY